LRFRGRWVTVLLPAGPDKIMNLNRRSVPVLAIAAALFFSAAAGLVVWRVERVLHGSARDLAGRQQLPFSVQVLASQPNPGFEGMPAPAVFKGGAAFNGRFYLSGPSGLFAYSTDGALEQIYRAGLELPAAPLGQMAVGTLADAHQPELLIATRGEGVLAFDGHSFRQIRPSDADARQITALLPLASGRLLLGTAKRGLLMYDGKALTRFHSTTNDVYVTALAGTESDLWIGTINSGVLHVRGGQITRIGEEQGLPDARVESIAACGEGVCVGTPVGVAEMRAESRQDRVERILAPGRYAHALIAADDFLLVGGMEGDGEDGILRLSLSAQPSATPRRGIAPVDADYEDTVHSEKGKSPALREAAALRAAGAVREATDVREATGLGGAGVEQFFAVADAFYAVTANGLLRQQPGGVWEKALGGQQALLTDRNVSALMTASDGRLWVGYFDRGLDILSATGSRVEHFEDEHVFCVNRIVEDPRKGAVAIATANGLVLFDRDGRQKQVLDREAGLIASHVTDVALYGDGMVAATPAGITFLDSSGVHSIYAFQGLVNNHVYALGASRDRLLAGTLGGLSLLSGGQIQRNLTTGNSGLRPNWITGLAAVGDSWLIGTYGGGVLRLDAQGTVTATDATRDGVIVNPGAILADGHLVLVGTLGEGLLVGDATGTRWKTFTAGLPSLNVTALAVYEGVVYVGTENGLVKIAEEKL
jgi:ligand-binding sensor domain-containing protein